VIRILIVDDNFQVRSVLRHLLEQDANWKVCGEAVDGGDAVQRTKETNPDLMVPDFRMPVMTGLQAARELAKVAPGVPVLLCTAHLSPPLIEQARQVGIQRAVSKLKASDIIDGVRALLRREPFFSQPA
jgi:DNA-binding NarL/FixJ family response regulator